MSSGNRGGGSSTNGSIPAASKKMVQSLKEIVNCPEAEIYAMLKECNMDPNEAVSRLLSQDPFHEVKSKREKKKENKDVYDSRPRGTSSTSNRGIRVGVDRYSSRGGTAQFGPDSGASRGKPAYKKDNGPTGHTNSTMAMVGNNMNKRQPPVSDASMDKAFPTDTPENFPAALPSAGFQTAWGGVAGQVSMADIVKMGRAHGKGPSSLNTSQHVNNNQHSVVSAARPQSNDLHPSQNHTFHESETNLESGITESHHVPPNDEWTLDEEPSAASVASVIEPYVDSEPAGDPCDRTKQQFRSHADDVRFVEGDTGDKAHANLVGSVPASNPNIQEDSSGTASGFGNDLYRNINSYEVHHREVDETSPSVSSVTANFQNLSLPKEDDESPSEDDGPAVKIPDHLQVQSADCSHLSFGSFGSGMNAPFSGSFASRPAQSNDEEAPMAADALSVEHAEARNPEYYEDEHLKTASDENTAHRMGADSGSFDASSVSQPTVTQEASEVTQENQYSFPASTADYSFDNNQQLNASFAQQQTSAQMQGLPSLSGVMHYSNSLPSTLLASNVQPLREAELAYSPFPISQTMPTKYGNSVSSISGPAASMVEAMKTSNFSTAQPTHTLPGSSVSGGPALPQQLVHPYSQPSVPMGHYASMLSYPFVPQSYPYLPSAFQQAFAAGNSNFPQSLAAAAMLPQYKNSVSVSSLPQSAAIAPGYGAFGNSNSIPSNFPLNHPTAPAGTSMSYDDILSSQYKDASHLLSLQQGPGSRTMSGAPGSAYYSFQGQSQQPSQQPAGFRQSQQPSQQQQHYGPLSGYPNFYHSQAGPTLEQQLQMSRDGSLGGPQGQQQKQTPQQIWQNGY